MAFGDGGIEVGGFYDGIVPILVGIDAVSVGPVSEDVAGDRDASGREAHYVFV